MQSHLNNLARLPGRGWCAPTEIKQPRRAVIPHRSAPLTATVSRQQRFSPRRASPWQRSLGYNPQVANATPRSAAKSNHVLSTMAAPRCDKTLCVDEAPMPFNTSKVSRRWRNSGFHGKHCRAAAAPHVARLLNAHFAAARAHNAPRPKAAARQPLNNMQHPRGDDPQGH